MRFSAAALRRLLRAVVRPVPDRSARSVKITDALLIMVLAPLIVLGTSSLWTAGPRPPWLAAELAAMLAVVVGVVLLARPWPLAALVGAFLTLLWQDSFSLLLMAVAYLAGRRMDDPRPALALFGVVAAVGTARIALTTSAAPEHWISGAVTLAFGTALPWVVGMYRRQRVELAMAGWELAERLEREQRIIAEQARLRERSRIAQDMHDSLGHELSLIALRAGALEVASGVDGAVRCSARELRENAAAATERLREIVGVLREDTESVALEPADEDAAALVDRARASGLEVRLIRRGDPARLSPMADRAVHRIVQEALTNAAKYAPEAPVTVLLEHTPEFTFVLVANPEPRGGPAPGVGGGRRGLIGLHERVRLVGGVLRAGTGHAGGWRVEAWLPAGPRRVLGTERHSPAGREGEEPSRTRRDYHRARIRTRRGLLVLVALSVTGTALFVLLVMAVA
ncbi:sensor histidine kinase [Thermobifida halotolerans]|uniref:histidine kinase n=1 Tax=Thermobifida halotolerans TaxID=483545 RepID=A0AA97LY51_9ACTN|nr:histidine kinase [Thermobifida halotolerans]UOE20038.1 sensor histidine kinase [Thermobifida halotolerans]